MGEFLIEVFWELVLKPSLEFLFHQAWKHLVLRPVQRRLAGRRFRRELERERRRSTDTAVAVH